MVERSDTTGHHCELARISGDELKAVFSALEEQIKLERQAEPGP
jgi:hypothetical protein